MTGIFFPPPPKKKVREYLSFVLSPYSYRRGLTIYSPSSFPLLFSPAFKCGEKSQKYIILHASIISQLVNVCVFRVVRITPDNKLLTKPVDKISRAYAYVHPARAARACVYSIQAAWTTPDTCMRECLFVGRSVWIHLHHNSIAL